MTVRERGRILLVEDDEDLRDSMAEFLRFEGFVVDTAANGREALDRLEREPKPSLILLDLMMPVMSGSEFRTEQEAGAHRGIPVILLTATHDGRRAAEELHAIAYFPKPVDLDRLVAAVRAHA